MNRTASDWVAAARRDMELKRLAEGKCPSCGLKRTPWHVQLVARVHRALKRWAR